MIELFRGVLSPQSLKNMDLLGLDKLNGRIEIASQADILDQLKGDYERTGFTEIQSDIPQYDELGITQLKDMKLT